MKTHGYPRRPEAGFAVVAVLLLVGLIATFSATYMRHTLMQGSTNPTTRSATQSREAVMSGLQFAQQAMLVGKEITSTTIAVDGKAATLTLADLGDNRARCDVTSVNSYGLGSSLVAEVARVPSGLPQYNHPDQLPRIPQEKVDEIMNDSTIPKHWYGGSQHIRDTELQGVVIVENAAGLWLDNVVIEGVIVSEDALVDDPFGDFSWSDVPCAITEGNLTIHPGSFLPGVSVVMPDGVFTTMGGNDYSIQIEGDAIAHTLEFNRPGSLRGNVAHVATLVTHSSLERPGHGRGFTPWAEGLDMRGVWDNEFLAFVPRYTSVSELDKITGFSFGNLGSSSVHGGN